MLRSLVVAQANALEKEYLQRHNRSYSAEPVRGLATAQARSQGASTEEGSKKRKAAGESGGEAAERRLVALLKEAVRFLAEIDQQEIFAHPVSVLPADRDCT